jgi:hypothetical protein
MAVNLFDSGIAKPGSLQKRVAQKLPYAPRHQRARVVKSAQAASVFLNQSFTASQVIDLLGQCRWFSFEEYVTFKDVSATQRTNFDTINTETVRDANFIYRADVQVKAARGLVKGELLVSPATGGNPAFLRVDGMSLVGDRTFDISGSFLLNSNFSIITGLSVNYLDDPANTYPMRLVDATELSIRYAAYNSITFKVGSTTITGSLTESQVPYKKARHFVTTRLDSSGMGLWINDDSIAVSSTNTQLSTLTNFQLGSGLKGTVSDLIFAPALTSNELKAIRTFLAIYKDIESATYQKSQTSLITDSYSRTFLPFGNTATKGKSFTQNADAICVDSDGTLYTAGIYDEDAHACGAYTSAGINKGIFPFGAVASSHAVATDATYAYFAGSVGSTSGQFGVRRYNKTTFALVNYSSVNGFPTSTSAGTSSDPSFYPIRGLSVSGSEIYVSDVQANKVKVYNTGTGAFVREFACTNPYQSTIDGSGNIWVVQKIAGAGLVTLFSSTGTQLKQITTVTKPSGVAISGTTLYVGDNGTKQIRIFDVSSTPTQSSVIGASVFASSRPVASRGKITPLFWREITDIDIDGSGNLYVSDSRYDIGARVESYKLSDSSRNYQLLGLLFVDVCDIDPDDQTIVYSRSHKFKLNYANKTWSYDACLVNSDKFTTDIRPDHIGNSFVNIVNILGDKFLLLSKATNSTEAIFALFRFNKTSEGETAIPCLTYNYSTGSYWVDGNGDGIVQSGEQNVALGLPFGTIASNGNLLSISVSSGTFILKITPVASLNGYGVPVYDFNSVQSFTIPGTANFANVKRLIESNGRIFISATSNSANTDGRFAGEIIAEYRLQSNLVKIREFKIPNNDNLLHVSKNIAVQDDLLFVSYLTSDEYYYPKTFRLIRVFNLLTGAEIAKTHLSPFPENLSWLDIDEPIRVKKSSTYPNQYLIAAQDVAYLQNQVTILDFQLNVIIGYDPLTTAFVDRINRSGGSISSNDILSVNTFIGSIRSLIDAGLIYEFDPFAGDDAKSAICKLIYQGADPEFLTNTSYSQSPAGKALYARNKGFTMLRGSDHSYLDTGVPGNKYATVSNGGLGVYVRNWIDNTGTAIGSGQLYIKPRTTGGTLVNYAANATRGTNYFVETFGFGWYTSNSDSAYRNGIFQASLGQEAIDTANISIGQRIGQLDTTASDLGCACIKKNLTASQELTLYNAVQTLMTAFGRNSTP